MPRQQLVTLIVSLLVIVLPVLNSCQAYSLQLIIPEDLASEWQAFLALRPLPDALTLLYTEKAPCYGVLSLQKKKWADISCTSAASNEEVFQSIIISRTYYAPVGYIWEDTAASNLIQPEGLLSGAIPIKAIEQIALPERALPINELRVGDEGYPLQDTLMLNWNPAELDAGGFFSRRRIQQAQEHVQALEKWLQALKAQEPAPPNRFVIAAVGDIMPGRGVTELLLSPNGLQKVFKDVLPHLQHADLLLGNLEGPATSLGTAAIKSFAFRFNPKVLASLKAAGFDYLSLANNHSFDYGKDAFLDSLTQLKQYGIASSGAGASLAQAYLPWTYQQSSAVRPIKVLSMSAWPREKNGFDGVASTAVSPDRPGVLWVGDGSGEHQDWAFQAIRDAFSADTYNILMIHGGQEWAMRPDEEQRKLYRRLVDAGADLILGAHSHVLQGVEAYKGALIAYSLGNFVFPGMDETLYGEESLVLQVSLVNGKPLYVDALPVRINNQTISIDSGTRIVSRFYAETERLHKD